VIAVVLSKHARRVELFDALSGAECASEPTERANRLSVVSGVDRGPD
jgi:hypothetical protein